jgi:hypothetical protein
MIADVQKESVGEVVLSKEAVKEICKKTALCFKQYLKGKFKRGCSMTAPENAAILLLAEALNK